MSKQINVNLVFNANTQLAKLQMNSLQASVNLLLTSLNQKISMNGLTEELSRAQNTAILLKTNLNSAFNVDTGRLDLTKFNNNLKTSGMTLLQYKNNLSLLGVEGTKAFNELTQAIMQGEMPLHRANNLVTNLMNTFGNSIKWSLAYGSIHKITQGFREAFKYAEDLNNSLTNIRVITNLSADEMAKFAEKANKAAKSLATSTTAYTDAALIYYRQGLDEKEVEKRTATTLKLSNVVGQGAQEVSEWMTSIWNNFDDGSKSLEYYADVISKLGITTASSAEEIATGLEKFAAVADTVGLSYEYATSALATVTAQTRLSADTVGTAFKTLFARILDLDLGKTLDDGTTLGLYSEALYKVGINIKDSAGNLRDMDNILDDMGAKWKTLDKDQLVALAKNVAGLRQYSLLIALMDNYDVFKTNVETAKMAEGALQELQEVWAESWEAASKRVKAAAEGLYDSLIDDKFFIGLNNVFADLLNGANKFIDAIGGLKTLLPLIAGLMLKAFGPAALGALLSSFHSIMGPGKEQQAETLGMRKDALRLSLEMAAKESDTPNANTATKETLTSQKDILESVEGITRHLSEEELLRLRYLKEINRQYQEALLLAGKQVDTTQKELLELERLSDNLRNQIQKSTRGTAGAVDNDYFKYAEAELSKATPEAEALRKKYLNGEELSSSEKDQIRDAMGWQKGGVGKSAGWNKQALEKQDISTTVKQRLLSEFEKDYKGVPDDVKKQHKEYLDIKEQDIKTTKKLEKEEENFSERQELLKENTEKTTDEFKAMQKLPLGQTIIGLAAGVGQAAAGFNMLSSAIGNVKEMFDSGKHTLQGWLGALTSLGFAIPMITSGLSTMTQMLQGSAAAAVAATKANLNLDGSKRILMLTEAGFNQILATQIALTLTSITQKERELLLDETKTALEKQELLVKKGFTEALAKEIVQNGTLDILNKKKIGSIWTRIKLKSAELLLDWQRLAVMALIAAAIGTTIAVVKALSNAYNADAIAAKEAAKHAEDTAKAYQEVKLSYDELKSSIEDYNKAQLAIDKLTEGTKEWKEAIYEANQQVLDLMEKYPELALYVLNTNGRLLITEEGQQKVLEEQNRKIIASSNINRNALLMARKAANKSTRTNLLRNLLDTESGWETTGKMILTLPIAPIGFGAIVENAREAKKSDETLYKLEQLFKESPEKYGQMLAAGSAEEVKKALSGANIDVNKELAKALYENKDSVDKLIKSNDELAKAELQLNQQKVDNILMNVATFNSREYGKGALLAALNIYDQVRDELENVSASDFAAHREDQRFAGKWAEENYFGTGWRATQAGKEAFIKYLEDLGYSKTEAEKAYENSNYKRGEIKYTTKDNEKTSVSYEDLAEATKDIQMLEKAEEIARKVNNYTNEVVSLSRSYSTDRTKNALSSYLENGNLSLLNEDEYYALKGKRKEELTNLVKNNIDEETIKAFGKETADEFAEGLYEELNNIENTEKLKNNRLLKQWKEYLETLKAGAEALGVNLAALEGYAEQLSEENNAGTENAKTMAELSVYHYKLAKGINELRKVLLDNIELLHTSTDDSLDYYEALGKVEELLEKTFGVKVSADFVKRNLKDIEDMSNGSAEALLRLRQAVVEEFVIHITTDEKEQNAILDSLQTLKDKINNDLTAEVKLDNSKALDAINTALATGRITVDELESMFKNADLSMPKYQMANIPHKSTSETVSRLSGGIFGEGENSTVVTSTTDTITYTQVPYFGTNKPVYDVNAAGETQLKGYINTKAKNYNSKKSDLENYNDNKKGVRAKDAGEGPTFSGTGNINSLKDITNYDQKSETQKAAANKKKLSDLDKELDRYHEINELLSDQERQLNKLSKAKDKVYGANRLSVMNQEIAKLKEIIENNKVLLASAEAYLVQDRNKLLSQFAVELNTSGRITNYEELQQGYINRLKANIGNEDAYKRIEEEYNLFKDVAGQYEGTLNKVEEQVEKVNDEMDKLYEFNLEKILYTVLIKVDISDDDKAYIDFLMQKINNDAFAAADAIQLMGRKTADTILKIEAYNLGISDTEAAFARGEITQEQYVETLRKYRDLLIDANATLLELRENVLTKLTEAFDAWNEKIKKSRDKLEHLNSVLEHYKNIIDIVGKKLLDINNLLMKELRDTLLNNAKDSLKAAKALKDAIDETLAGYKAAREAAQDEESRKEWDKQIELAEEKAAEAAETVNKLFETTLKLAKSNFEDTVNDIADMFSESISGIYDSLEDLRKGWDRLQEVSERYLTTYKQTYEINKLNRKIQLDIEKSNNLGNQKQLHGLQEEMLKMTKDGLKLSKYDLEYLLKKYDLMVAELALREAQNAKSIVRLQRDSEGNFGYVYTADQNNIDKTKLEYEDKLYAYQEFSDKIDRQLTETAIKLNEWAYEQIQNAALLYGEGTQKYEEEVSRILLQYNEDMLYISNEYGKLTDRNLSINELFNAGVAETYNDTYLGEIYPDYNEFSENYNATTGIIKTTIDLLKAAETQYEINTKKVFDDAGLDIRNYKNIVSTDLKEVRKESGDTSEKIRNMSDEMKTSIDLATMYVQGFLLTYSSQMETIRNNTDTTITKINGLIASYRDLATQAGIATEAERTYLAVKSLASVVSTTPDVTQQQYVTSLPVVETKQTNIITGYMARAEHIATKDGNLIGTYSKHLDDIKNGTSLTTSEGYVLYRDKYGYLYVRAKASPHYWYKFNDLGTKNGQRYIKKGQLAYNGIGISFDTGGYTGSWGPEGRLAMLHQKELVLNKDDTENFLAAIGIVRDISDQIEKNALIMRSLNIFTDYRTALPQNKETLQQEVTIHAEFPNATNHNEIEEAFRNLTNLASQYANRKF